MNKEIELKELIKNIKYIIYNEELNDIKKIELLKEHIAYYKKFELAM